MKTTVLSPVGTDLASRRSAAALRAEIELLLHAHQRVAIDLSGVQTTSESYADELFGILARDFGLEGFSHQISIRGASADVLRRVAGAIKERLDVGSNDLNARLQALVAAKNSATKRASCDGTSGFVTPAIPAH